MATSNEQSQPSFTTIICARMTTNPKNLAKLGRYFLI